MFVPDDVSVHIQLGPHKFSTDVGNPEVIKRRLDRADLYIPERFGWDDLERQKLTEIAKGNSETYRQGLELYSDPREAFMRALVKAMYARYVTVDFIDIGKRDYLYGPTNLLSPLSDVRRIDHSNLTGLSDDELLERKINRELDGLHDFSLANLCRNAVMLSCFGPKVRHNLNLNPKLARKSHVAVFMTLGNLHEVPILDGLSRAAADQSQVSSSYALGKPVYDESRRIHEAAMAGIQLTAEEERLLCLRGMFSLFNTDLIYSQGSFAKDWNTLNREQRHQARYQISSQLSFEELWTYMTGKIHEQPSGRQLYEKIYDLACTAIHDAAEAARDTN